MLSFLQREARDRVKQASFMMKRAVDANDLRGALKHANGFVLELRTGELTPKVYYELYMDIFDQLGFLEMYFGSLQRSGTPLNTIYELVQHTANVLVRLYLMITAGAVYIKSGQTTAKEVLMDLLEMVKGVQQPLRGLFLRYYLAQKCKDKLPDIGSPYEGIGGSLDDAVHFITTNFGEMNRLWVRMQHSGHTKNKKRRERERQELRILVGGNLNQLGSLSGVDLRLYESVILPRLLAEVIQCRDKIAQPYLIECIVQAFPVEYLYATLDKILECLPQLVTDYSVLRPIFTTLITRIKDEAIAAASSDGAAGDGSSARSGVAPDAEVFSKLLRAISSVASDPAGAFRGGPVAVLKPAAEGDAPEDAPKIPATSAGPEAIAALLEIYTSLMSFALTCFPNDLAQFDEILSRCAHNLTDILGSAEYAASETGSTETPSGVAKSTLSRLTGGLVSESAPAQPEPSTSFPTITKSAINLNDECSKLVVGLLSLVQTALGLGVLSLENYGSLMSPLTFNFRRSVAFKLLDSVLAAGVRVHSADIVRRLCQTISPLIRDETGTPNEAEEDQSQFLHEQHSVAKLIQLFGGTTDAGVLAADGKSEAAADTDAHFQVYTVAGELLSHGGSRRICITFPPLVFGCLQLARRIRIREAAGASVKVSVKRVYQFLHEFCTALGATHTDLALKLFVQCALASEGPGFASEFFSQSFILYEEITDSKLQIRSLQLIGTALHSCASIELDNYEALCARCTQLSIKLLRKADQVKLVLLCARLFWRGQIGEGSDYRRPKEVLHCLQKALSIADKCMPPQPGLFVDIFDSYVYFFEKHCPTVQAVHLRDLVSLCREQTSVMKHGVDREEAVSHLQNIVAKIEHSKSTKDGATLYAEVNVSE